MSMLAVLAGILVTVISGLVVTLAARQLQRIDARRAQEQTNLDEKLDRALRGISRIERVMISKDPTLLDAFRGDA
jgi:hypothetical protein